MIKDNLAHLKNKICLKKGPSIGEGRGVLCILRLPLTNALNWSLMILVLAIFLGQSINLGLKQTNFPTFCRWT